MEDIGEGGSSSIFERPPHEVTAVFRPGLGNVEEPDILREIFPFRKRFAGYIFWIKDKVQPPVVIRVMIVEVLLSDL
jgi:hypothetical protein